MIRENVAHARRALLASVFVGGVVAASIVAAGPALADPVAYGTAGSIPVPDGPMELAIDSASHTAYVTQADGNTLATVDLTSGTVTGTVAVGTYPTAVALDAASHRAYTASGSDGTVSVVDTNTGTVVATPTFASSPSGLATDPSDATVLVATGGDGLVTELDARTGDVLRTVSVGASADRIAVDTATQRAYVTDGPDNSVAVLDLATLTLERTITGPELTSPYGIAVDPGNGTVVVGNLGGDGDTATAIDTRAGDVLNSVSVGTTPIGIAVDANDHRVYVGNNTDSSMTVLDSTDGSVLGTVGLADAPRGVAVDTLTHTAWAATASAGALLGVTAGGAASPPAPRTTTVTVGDTDGSAVTGRATTLTATVTPKATDGTAHFAVDGAEIAGCAAVPVRAGVASCTTTFATAGNKRISVAYTGSPTFAAADGSSSLLVGDGTKTFAGSVTRCTDSSGSIVAVDYGAFGGSVTRACDLQRPVRGIDLLTDSGYTTSGTQHDGPAFLCRIGSTLFEHGTQYPTAQTEKCQQTPPATAYWSYWLAPAGQNSWTYSSFGAYTDTPVPGEVQAWVYGGTDIAGTTGAPTFTPDQVRHAGQATVKAGRPTVSGRTAVGNVLTAATTPWYPTRTAVSYQWLRNGVAIRGATARSYRLTSGDLHRRIAVRASGVLAGYVSSVVVSSARTIGAGTLPAWRVTVGGKARGGHTLVGHISSHGGPATHLTYRWYRSGKPIHGAIHARHRITRRDVGRTLRLQVTRTASGYATSVHRSKAVKPRR